MIVSMPSLTFYGGVNEIGGNKVLLEEGNTTLFFDFGTSFARRYQYFEEYLKPRASAGLLDLLEMGLLPPLRGIYRDDLAGKAPWHRFESSPFYRELGIDGVLLSHAHVDHSGYISFLREDIPIYSTSMSAFIAKAMQDSGKGDFEKEVCYSIPKEEVAGVLQATSWQREKAQQRPFRVLDSPSFSREALEFWKKTSGGRRLSPRPLEAVGRVGALPLQSFPVDHSIFGATAFAVETSSGWVVYTGDLRLHGRRGYLLEEFIDSATQLRPAVLICEGTNVENSDIVVSEEEVYTKALKTVKEAKALVIADFGPRNVERLLIFRQVAEETSRCLVISSKDAYLLKAMRYVSPEVPDIASDTVIHIYKDAKARLDKWEDEIREEYQSKLVTPEEIRQHQCSYILCFSFFDIDELPDIMPQKGSIYIYSSSEAHSEEQVMDQWRLHNWLEHFGIQAVGLPVQQDDGKWVIPQNDRGLHASGHARGPELLDLIRNIAPKTLLPIHTEHPNYFVRNLEGSGIEVRLLEYGERTSFP
ncbi:MAG TPA: MBL fold metallo-hydrolase RNA specificity domain-containing protein [Dehalococcoidia bacterium]|nr:MBL fold metallo-hydrolase RNA specificity domain-containing protein [Dehalococcoidia bacterium]